MSRTALLVVGPSLQRLFCKGVGEQDIVELANILFERFRGDGGDIDKQSLMDDLKKYGDIRSTIQELNQQVDKLRNQVDEFQSQKQGLEVQNQKMLSILAYSDPVVKFLHGSDDSFSNDEDNIKILAMIAFILYTLYLSYVGLEKLTDDDINEFAPLSRSAAARGEEAVSIPELKMAVAKALRALIDKLDTTS